MKKIGLFALCLLSAAAASAQTELVKDLERSLKSNIDDYPKTIQALQPAFTNPETADQPYAWFVAGKAGMDYFDKQQIYKQMGQEVNATAMSNALIDGYDKLIQAMRRDSVPDAKGKIKPKYSKDAVKLINNHHIDFNRAGIYLWEAQDYNGAYKAWDYYLSIPNDPVLGKNAPAMPADTIVGDIYYNMALAAWQAERLDDALAAFDKSLAVGNTKKNVFDYAISVAYQNNHDTAKMAEYASMAQPLYGSEDDRYIGFIVNDKLQNKQFEEARTLLEKYIQLNPEDSQLYLVLGTIYDYQEKTGLAKENYKKAIDLNPQNAQALYNYGRQFYNEALNLDNEAQGPETTAQQYNDLRLNKINPLFQEAVKYMEEAYAINPEATHDALALLRACYYNLNDQENLKRIDDILGL